MHDSLVSALDHVNLTATLAGDGPFTVFAPTDQAFTDAGIDLSTFDTDEENETLADILLYTSWTVLLMQQTSPTGWWPPCSAATT